METDEEKQERRLSSSCSSSFSLVDDDSGDTNAYSEDDESNDGAYPEMQTAQGAFTCSWCSLRSYRKYWQIFGKLPFVKPSNARARVLVLTTYSTAHQNAIFTGEVSGCFFFPSAFEVDPIGESKDRHTCLLMLGTLLMQLSILPIAKSASFFLSLPILNKDPFSYLLLSLEMRSVCLSVCLFVSFHSLVVCLSVCLSDQDQNQNQSKSTVNMDP